MTSLRLRSLLYVPGHLEALVAKAGKTETDVVILDLEDAVPPNEKDKARQLLSQSTAILREMGKSVAVRINNDDAMVDDDLEAAAAAGPDILILPKVESQAFVCQVAQFLQHEGCSDTSLVALIETPIGLVKAVEIAASHDKLIALNLGTEDFSLEMGMEPEWDGLLYPSQQIVIAARSANKIPLGYAGSIANFGNIEAFETIVHRSAKLGFEGGFAIHPNQIHTLNSVFTPSENDRMQAQRIIKAAEQSFEQGLGAVSLDNNMIDRPVIERARRLLNRS